MTGNRAKTRTRRAYHAQRDGGGRWKLRPEVTWLPRDLAKANELIDARPCPFWLCSCVLCHLHTFMNTLRRPAEALGISSLVDDSGQLKRWFHVMSSGNRKGCRCHQKCA